MDFEQIKKLARERIPENRVNMIVVALIVLVAPSLILYATGTKYEFDLVALREGVGTFIHKIPGDSKLIGISYAISFFLLHHLEVGSCHFFRCNIYKKSKVSDIKNGFKNYLLTFLSMGAKTILVAIGMSLCVVPGLIIGLGLFLVPYIRAENPHMSVGETLKLSWNKMKGHKLDLIYLQFSFIGWIILSILSLGIIGIIYVAPYIQQSQAIFADKVLSSVQQENPQFAWSSEI